MEGQLRPYGAEQMDWYIGYSVVVEEYRYSGYPDLTVTLYPHVVCNNMYNCPGDGAAGAPSRLEIRNRFVDACDSGVYEAYDFGGYRDDIYEIVLSDNFYNSCGTRDQLTADVAFADGHREFLVGYRTY